MEILVLPKDTWKTCLRLIRNQLKNWFNLQSPLLFWKEGVPPSTHCSLVLQTLPTEQRRGCFLMFKLTIFKIFIHYTSVGASLGCWLNE